jgi:cytoskeletal protein CcmA (bactofilin family)
MINAITDNRTGTPTLGQTAALNRTVLATPTNITAGTITTVSGNVTGSVGSVSGLTASDVGAIKAKTDSLTYTVAGVVDANIQRINDVVITGDGQTGTEFGV